MKMLAAALAAALLCGSAAAQGVAPSAGQAPAPAAPKEADGAKAQRVHEKAAKDAKAPTKPAPKGGATAAKEPPCEPVKPCPIE